MMAIYLIAAGALILLVVLFLIIRNYRSEDQKIVPISELKEIKDIVSSPINLNNNSSKTTIEDNAHKESFNLSDQLVKENILKKDVAGANSQGESQDKEGINDSAKLKDVMSELLTLKERSLKQQAAGQDQIAKLMQENQRLTDALQREVASKPSASVNEVAQKILNEKKAQLDQAHLALDNLTKENLALKKELENISMKQISVPAQIIDQNELTNWKEISAKLELQKNGLQETINKQAQEIQTLITELTLLKDASEQAQMSHRSAVEDLKKAHEELLTQWKRAEEKSKEFELNAEAARLAYEKKIVESEEKIEVLRNQLHNMNQSQSEVVNKEIDEIKEKLITISKEKEEVLLRNAEIESNFKKLKEFNTHLLEKEKLLQYELTKSRAQALGLEKICEDFKAQIDFMTKSLDAVRK